MRLPWGGRWTDSAGATGLRPERGALGPASSTAESRCGSLVWQICALALQYLGVCGGRCGARGGAGLSSAAASTCARDVTSAACAPKRTCGTLHVNSLLVMLEGLMSHRLQLRSEKKGTGEAVAQGNTRRRAMPA